ncbi:hypothetical protein GYH30_005490 [Glycine max]|uniref:Uncharacterized protein n=1 Tax=Glycine max TaxID=3847 RepID=A0A0R0L2T9_SOYBN|nr:hypothetical protein GYH30_005490 [Glycine max]
MFSSRSVCLAFITRHGCPPNLTSGISRDSDSTYNIFIIKMSKHEKPTKIFKINLTYITSYFLELHYIMAFTIISMAKSQ